jgi:hypothetical protein
MYGGHRGDVLSLQDKENWSGIHLDAKKKQSNVRSIPTIITDSSSQGEDDSIQTQVLILSWEPVLTTMNGTCDAVMSVQALEIGSVKCREQ